jgi:hypothetical protein
MVLLGMNRFMHGVEAQVEKMEMSCEMDCCDSHDDCEKEDDASSDHNCPAGCDCACCFHITAMYYQYIPMPASEVQSYHFAGYINTYHFEYYIPLFQPPRQA